MQQSVRCRAYQNFSNHTDPIGKKPFVALSLLSAHFPFSFGEPMQLVCYHIILFLHLFLASFWHWLVHVASLHIHHQFRRLCFDKITFQFVRQRFKLDENNNSINNCTIIRLQVTSATVNRRANNSTKRQHGKNILTCNVWLWLLLLLLSWINMNMVEVQ